MNYKQLIAALKEATAPDQNLNAEIVLGLYPTVQFLYSTDLTSPVVFGAEPLIKDGAPLPNFTGSFDAASTLFPAGIWWEVCSPYGASFEGRALAYKESQLVCLVRHKVSTIALVIAALASRRLA